MISVEGIEEVLPFGRRVVDKHPKQVVAAFLNRTGGCEISAFKVA